MFDAARNASSTSLQLSPRNDRAQTVAALADEITLLAGHLNSANHRLLKLIAEFDSNSGWNDEGCQSCAHWLNFKVGIDMGAAREGSRCTRTDGAAEDFGGDGSRADQLLEGACHHACRERAH